MFHVLETKEVCTGFWLGGRRETDHLEDIGLDGKIVLKRVFKRWNGEAWTLLGWPRIGTGVGRL
jgi:hypothetical protein